MRPYAIAAAMAFLFLFSLTQCVVIGGMAFDSVRAHGELKQVQADLVAAQDQAAGQAASEFYHGMFQLCWDAYQGYGYPEDDVIEGCNAHVVEERALKTHLQPAPGYEP